MYSCAVHYIRNIKSNMVASGLYNMTIKKSCMYDVNVSNFYRALQKFPFLPEEMVQPMREYMIESLQAKGVQNDQFFNYLRKRLNQDFAKKSFFTMVMNNPKFMHVTTNYSESFNSSLNSFCRSVTRSKKLVNVVRNIRTYSIGEYRQAESQYLNQKSLYCPSEDALKNYKLTRRLVIEINKLTLRPTRSCCEKIGRLIHPKYFYSRLNEDSRDFDQNFSF